jgi:hypothetical protein
MAEIITVVAISIGADALNDLGRLTGLASFGRFNRPALGHHRHCPYLTGNYTFIYR